ncbi:uncharacterized protein PHACADRAFT_172980 [Phanerochaete carnosa HHB-10118-sp]|uniref:C2H2-type domain-containing protein n=1 Tax=Phanerochaete carnosa (strain HHB-10118-sp) TaxID=650164 RepID=K5V445_PHACS|nr:uncharacterized protein PHACADRAFT_172980 [Phanerochaete carnosa HHB-10118-sp]EKM57346.1 hypothetical protein PHACADRAFT_172980 [Phanerochaete carnosa HHB-10118-sp]
MPPRRSFRPRNLICPVSGCNKLLSAQSGLSQHLNAAHRRPSPPAPSSMLLPLSPTVPSHEDFPLHQEPTSEDESQPQPSQKDSQSNFCTVCHPILNGRPCDAQGNFLSAGEPPVPASPRSDNSFSPFEDREQFEVTNFLFQRSQMPAGQIDFLMQLLASKYGDPILDNADHMKALIDDISNGDIPWQSFAGQYSGVIPESNPPPWMAREYEVFFRCPHQVGQNMLGNPDFANEMDFAPKRVYSQQGEREYQDFMLGSWAWNQANIIAQDEATHGSMFCPFILGSDKTTISVATGQNEYYPLYMSLGVIHNSTRRSHRNSVALIGFLAIPKTDRQYQNDPAFRKFRRQLFHSSLTHILQSLRSGMTVPEVIKCADGHYRRVVFGLGPYIADYPEQALLACIVQGWCPRCTAHPSNLDEGGISRSREHTRLLMDALDTKALWDNYGAIGDIMPFTVNFPRADIHELLSPDLLHQVIKETFKDHLVTWVEEYLVLKHGKTRAAVIMADIDRRIALAPAFPGLRRFPEGRGFKQWTGDDSKALMKVYLSAIAGHVPSGIVRTFSAFLDFCYLIRRDVIDEHTLSTIDDALARFHRERVVFIDENVRPEGFSLPRQHALVHYRRLIILFGAPNGLCSLITESKHIKAVKELYCCSSKHNALSQMLVTNQRLDKLAAFRVELAARGMLDGPLPGLLTHFPLSPPPPQLAIPTTKGSLPTDDNDDEGAIDGDQVEAEVVLARNPKTLAHTLGHPTLSELIRRFLYDLIHPQADTPGSDVDISPCPDAPPRIIVYPSAIATYYAPSDWSGSSGMRHERIRSVPSWRGEPKRQDCVYVNADSSVPGFSGLHAARVLLFFAFKHAGVTLPCTLVTWFSPVSNTPCQDTGMWIVEPDADQAGQRIKGVVHVDTIVRGAHLLPVFGDEFVSHTLEHTDSLDAFRAFYVNKYADHHAHEIAS